MQLAFAKRHVWSKHKCTTWLNNLVLCRINCQQKPEPLVNVICDVGISGTYAGRWSMYQTQVTDIACDNESVLI